jgi:3-oxosteroid 1-dehydrogenase
MSNPPLKSEVDVVVVGSGNGALTAAITAHDLANADVIVVEKAEYFGGTSALSGGGVWVPNNRYAKAAGAKDSCEEALTYLTHTIPEDIARPDMIKAYLKGAPEMVDFLHENTRVRYTSLKKYPDYFTDLPGAREGHRSMEPETINITELKDDVDRMLTGGVMYIFYKYAITQVEGQVLIGKLKGWWKIMAKMLLRYYTDIPWLLRRKGFSRRTGGGGAGVIRLFLSAKDRGIPVYTNTPFESLITEGDKVVGVVVSQNGVKKEIRARKGVILAAGGFEQNQQMREQYLPKPTSNQWSAGCKTNTGDAIQAAQSLGAATGLMNEAWWCTTKVFPDRPYPFLGIINKSLPGSIVVNKAGKRFSNESQNYISFLKETFATHSDENPCIPMYMVFDTHFRKHRNVWPAALPDSMLPQSYFDSGLLAFGDTPEELAEKLGIDPQGLADTIKRFNGFVDTGKDEDFQRGDAAYDRYYGDPEYQPNPCLGKIEKGPFIAIKLDAGDFGTQGGMVTNVNGQVVRENGEAIEGLYACGNCTMAVLPTYPGPGSTLGPAMTFGYLAGKHIANKVD